MTRMIEIHWSRPAASSPPLKYVKPQKKEPPVKREPLAKRLQRIKAFLQQHLDHVDTPTGKALEGFFFSINILAVILFVVGTYVPESSLLIAAEVSIVGIFIVEYLLRFWAAQKKLRFVFHWYSLIDLLSILPVLFALVNLSFLRVFRAGKLLRALRTVRILRAQRQFKALSPTSETGSLIIRLIFGIAALVFISAGFLWAIEHQEHPQDFSNLGKALGYSAIKLVTLGLANFPDVTTAGTIVTIIMLVLGIPFILWNIGKIVLKVLNIHVSFKR